MIWMDVDIALSEVPVNVLPLTSDSDFKTVDEGILFNEGGMDLYWHFVTTGGATSVISVTPTSSGLHDWNHQDHGMYTLEIPASGGTIDNDAEGFGYFTGVANAVLPFRGPTIGFRAAALNNALIDGGDLFDVNLKEISGDSDAADNLEAMFDGTGYYELHAPATQEQLVGLAGGLAVQASAEGGTITDGTEGATSYTDTASHGGSAWTLTNQAQGVGIDVRLEFDIGDINAHPVALHFHGYFDDQSGPDKTVEIQVYNWLSAGYETIETLTNASANQTLELPLTVNNAGDSGGDEGTVWVRFVMSAQETSNVLYIDHCTVGYVNGIQTDANGYVKMSNGTGTGQLALNNGKVDVGLIEGGDASNVINAQCDTALSDINLDYLMKTALSGAANPTYSEVTDGSLMSWVMTKEGDSSDFTASTDSLEGLQATTAGVGNIPWVYTVYAGPGATNPIGNAEVRVTSDAAGTTQVAGPQFTDATTGATTFYLDAGTYYFWIVAPGYVFSLPDTEVVS